MLVAALRRRPARGCRPASRSLAPRMCPRPPPSLATIAARVDAASTTCCGERERWAAFDPDLAGPFDEIRRMVRSGGKRLRPAFCHWGFVGAGGDPDDERVVDAGAAFELMHAFALFHDDVMDDSASRRGAPTTHAVYAGDARPSDVGRRVAALRRGRGDPRRRPGLRARPTSC